MTTLFPMPEPEKPVTRYLPKEWCDEVVPESQADPNAFLKQEGGNWLLVPAQETIAEAGPYCIAVTHGDLIAFCSHRHYGSCEIKVAEDGSYTLSDTFPADATAFAFDDGDLEDFYSTLPELIENSRQNDPDAFTPPYETTVSAWFWGETTTFRVVIEEGAARLDRLPEPPLVMPYTNWRGETATRRLRPIAVKHKATEWHREPQWILEAFDYERQEMRGFALKDFGMASITELVIKGANIDLEKLKALAEESLKPGVLLRVENDDPLTLLKAAMQAESTAAFKEKRATADWYEKAAIAVLEANNG